MPLVNIQVPLDMWEGDDKSGSIVLWLYPEGAHVKEGDLIAEILVEKVTLELNAPATGTLRIAKPPEVAFEKGEILGAIEA